MPINVYESYRSQRGEFGTTNYGEIDYIANGSADMEEIRAAVEAAAPGEHNGVPLDTIEPVVITFDSGGWWNVTARYRQNTGGDAQPTGESRFSFDISNTTQHITQSKEVLKSIVRTDAGPIDFTTTNTGGAIGQAEDGTVAGANIDITVFRWTENHVIDLADMTAAYVQTIYLRSHQVNADSFRGFAAGEVRLTRCSGGQRADGDFAVTFEFAALPNATNIPVGTDITIATKRGWDYLDVVYEQFVPTSGSTKILSMRPQVVSVHRTYDYANYADLNLPAPTQLS